MQCNDERLLRPAEGSLAGARAITNTQAITQDYTNLADTYSPSWCGCHESSQGASQTPPLQALPHAAEEGLVVGSGVTGAESTAAAGRCALSEAECTSESAWELTCPGAAACGGRRARCRRPASRALTPPAAAGRCESASSRRSPRKRSSAQQHRKCCMIRWCGVLERVSGRYLRRKYLS